MKNINKLLPVVLVHDEASEKISRVFKRFKSCEIPRLTDTGLPRKWHIISSFNEIKNVLSSDKTTRNRRLLCIYGDGNSHHYTYGICRVFADEISKNYSYIHIDRHDDYGDSRDLITCGSFVNNIMSDSNAKKIVIIGAYSQTNNKDILSLEKCDRESLERFLKNFIRGTPDDVYISIDLDVLESGITTSYGNGNLKLEDLLGIIRILRREKCILGADVLGYSSGDISAEQHLQNIQTYKEVIYSFLR